VTAVAAPTRQPILDGQGDELGPVATFGAQFFVVGAFIFLFQVTGFEILPPATGAALFAGTLGVLLLTPRLVLQRIPVSMLALLMVGWLAASVTWTDSAEGTGLALRQLLPILLGMMIVAGTISLNHLVSALLWGFRIAVLITLGAVAALPEARIHIDPLGELPDLDGWHGLFPHKNIMTPFLVIGLLTILTFDRTKLLKWTSLVAIGVLLAGSDSVTGLSSALMAVSVWVWLQLYRNLDVRNSSIFVVSSLSVGVFGLLGLAASLSTVTSASGKDVTLTGRTFIWQGTLEAIVERPLLGWGFGGIFVADPPTPRTAELWRSIGFTAHHAHNGLLDVVVQLGVVGFALFALLFLTTMVDGIAMIRDRPKVGAWIVSVLVVQLYISFSENAFIGYGWLAVVVMLRILSLRTVGMELSTGRQLVDRLDRFRQPGHQRARRQPAPARAAR
jgi:O-antigen ligase